MTNTLKTESREGVFSITLTRAEEYNTITPAMRDELNGALDDARADEGVRVILLAAEGPAFCAGYGLDWSTQEQENPLVTQTAWDSVADLRNLSSFTDVFSKLWYMPKPTIAAVQGWCIGGGTDLVLWSDIIVAGESAKFGYPPSRVWGIPTTPMWIYKLGVERAKRYLFTGDEISASEAARIGLVLETVPDGLLLTKALELANRIAKIPMNQLAMIKMLCNQTFDNMGLSSGRLLSQLFDGVARHTEEGLGFVARAREVGFRQAVRERDDPFGDYGSRRKT